MSKLIITITNEGGMRVGHHEIEGFNSLTEAEERRRTDYVVNQIRIAAEARKYFDDFEEPNLLHRPSEPFALDYSDPTNYLRTENVNALWVEIGNLLRGARLNFAASRIVKQIETEYDKDTPENRNIRYDLHLDKMERFYLAVFELARIEDLMVRLLFEFFGDTFISIDKSKKQWEKQLTWDAMKDALNRRGKPEKTAHPRVEAMRDDDYDSLMTLVRAYKSPKLLELTEFRDRRTHRVTPSVDYPELGAVLSSSETLETAIVVPIGVTRFKPEYEFLQLYETAKTVYKQLLDMLRGLNAITHA